MTMYQFLFYVFASSAVLSAIRVISVKNPVHAALFLVLTFFSTALAVPPWFTDSRDWWE